MYRIVARATANGQLKVTKLSQWKRAKREDGVEQVRLERLAETTELTVQQRRIEKALEGLTTVEKYDEVAGLVCPHIAIYDYALGQIRDVPTYQVIEDVERYESLLDLRCKSQSATKGSDSWGRRRKSTTFSKSGRHKILEAGGAIEKEGKQDDCLIVTVTIPGGGFRVCDAVARWSGYFANLMTQQVRNFDRKHPGKEGRGYFYVWELQKRGALHMHWCLVGYPQSVAVAVKDAWYRALDVVGRKEGINLFKSESGRNWRERPEKWQWDIQEIEKSVAGYFAKYASKEAVGAKEKAVRGFGGDARQVSPGRWYSISYSIRSWMESHSCSIDLVVRDWWELEYCMDAIRLCMDALDLHGCTVYDFEVLGETGKAFAVGEVESYLLKSDSYAVFLGRMRLLKREWRDRPLEEKISGAGLDKSLVSVV